MKWLGDNRAEAWIEDYIPALQDWLLVCDSYLILSDKNEILVDEITTHHNFRRLGYGTRLIEEIQAKGFKVVPIGIKNTTEAQLFWKSLGMEDGLGKEEER